MPCSALRLGTPFGCIPRPILPDGLRGQVRRALPLTSPWPIGYVAFKGVKGEGCARHPHPVAGKPALRLPVPPLTPFPAGIGLGLATYQEC